MPSERAGGKPSAPPPPASEVQRLGREQAVSFILAMLLAREAMRAPDPVVAVHEASSFVRRLLTCPDLDKFNRYYGEGASDEFQKSVFERIDAVVDLADDFLAEFLGFRHPNNS
jgi:hypothetical protein